MSQQQDLRTVISNLPAKENIAALQARLEAAGLDTNLSSAPAGQVAESFITTMSTLLERPAGELTLNQIRAITAEVKATSNALEPNITAETILQGFKKLDGGVIELTLPVGTTIQQSGRLLNAAAREKGMKFPVFFEGNAEFWKDNEANDALQTIPGKTYRFKIPADSVSKTRAKQIKEYGQGAPLGAVAIAETCERLNTENNGTLFRDANGNKVWVRGSAPGVVRGSNSGVGVSVWGRRDDDRSAEVAYAFSVHART